MEEEVKNDLASIAFTHPYYRNMVDNTFNYINELEEKNKELQKEVEKLRSIIYGKSIQELGVSKLYEKGDD